MALSGLDPDGHQTFPLRFGFDALGDHVQPQ
jgi:hypothetical protein